MGITIYLKPSEILFISKIFSVKNIGLRWDKKIKKTKENNYGEKRSGLRGLQKIKD